LTGHIIHIDNFGNLITDIMEKDLPEQKEAVIIEVGNRTIAGLSRTYAEGEEFLALIGSSGYLEVSRKDGNAAALLGVKVDDKVILR
jgi:S-adenosylmethionine hydrolase